MRDFYELINQYPWTTIFLAIFIYEVIKCVMSNLKSKHSKKCTFYTLRFGCSFAAVNTIKPQLL